jgi:hypothetical protein
MDRAGRFGLRRRMDRFGSVCRTDRVDRMSRDDRIDLTVFMRRKGFLDYVR